MSVKEDKEKLPQEVNVAVKVIKSVILESQRRAASKVNSEQLALYLGIGRYISEHSRKGFWGTGAIECISTQLQRELPGLRGFGARQLKNMRSFYENWKPYLNSAAMAAELKNDAVSHQQMGTISDKDRIIVPVISENWQPMAAEIQIKEFLGISFTHHIETVSKFFALKVQGGKPSERIQRKRNAALRKRKGHTEITEITDLWSLRKKPPRREAGD